MREKEKKLSTVRLAKGDQAADILLFSEAAALAKQQLIGGLSDFKYSKPEGYSHL